MPQDRPFVTVKYAQTLDGRIATSTGHSRWVSGEESRVLAHRLRAENDAVLVGIGTVIADNPRLDVRLWSGPHPRRVIVDSTLRIPNDAAILQAPGGAPIVVTSVHADQGRSAELEGMGVTVLRAGSAEGRVDLERLLRELFGVGIGSLLVEGGPTIVTSLLASRLVDWMAVIVSPKILGSGIDAIGDLRARTLDQAIELADVSVEASGRDTVFWGRPSWPSE